MADYVLLPATTYRAPSPQGRRGKRHLNTIVEEEVEEMQPPRHAAVRGRGRTSSQDKIEQWLSPMSDHFPTPRGFHFLAAPILPSSPSAVSMDESESPHSSSASSGLVDPWKRASCTTDATEFDDLDIYDVSDSETELDRKTATITRQNSVRRNSVRSSASSTKNLPRLVTTQPPAAPTSAPTEFKKLSSPVGPTPTSAVPMSPAMMSYMQAQQSLEVPTISAPPSLDGSLSSDQLAQMSAPPTPVIGCQDEEDQGWSGVHLQPGALATLAALSGSTAGSEVDYTEHQEQVLEVPIPTEPEQPAQEMSEMRQAAPLRLFTQLTQQQRNHSSIIMSPAQQRSLAGLTKLEIPSPGGFFSGLSPRTRNTWQGMTQSPAEEAPPTSGTAEQFYNIPWKTQSAPPLPALPPPPPRPLHMTSGDFSSSPIEQVIETEDKFPTGDLPTAVRVEATPITARIVPVAEPTVSSVTLEEPTASSPIEEVVATEIVTDYDPEYIRQQQEANLSQVSRTEMWLMAQSAYLKNISVMSEPEVEEEEEQQETKTVQPEQPKVEIAPAVPPKDTEITALVRKKTVRFSEDVKSPGVKIPRSLPSKLIHLESAYYRAFTDLLIRTSPADAFTNRLPRFEALQAQRVSLRASHRNQLLGKYQLSVVPLSAKKRMSANVVRGDADLTDDPAKIRADKEADARAQMAMPAWQVAAQKILNGGRLISAAPVHKRLARLSRMVPTNGVSRDRARILDLGGQGTCDWAWHAAIAYPNTKIYTVTTKAVRQLSNAHIRGPPNHRQVAVERLTRLPFADDQFDLIHATELHSLLKFVGENGQDEWEACLAECMRVLKPGGYLEFQVLDSDIVNAGPLGNAKSVEFGFALKTLGYDPSPSKMFAGRLGRAGFENIRRAWVCLPCGPKPTSPVSAPVDPKTGLPVQTVAMEAMVSGSADAMAAVTGLVGGWSWERWLLRCEVERVAGELRLSDIATSGSRAVSEAGKSIEGVHAVVEEGRACGAGWRMLRGFARKPPRNVETIDIVLDL